MSLKVLEDINKKFGPGSLIRLGDNPIEKPETISTGIIGLDHALGIGGFPIGRLVEVYGQSGTGKSCICYQTMASAQAKGYNVAYIDAEQAFDPGTAEMLGVKVDDLFVSQPSSGNEALEIAELLIKSKEFKLVIIDSVAALVPTEELTADYGDAVIGRQAKLVSQACRRLSPLCNENNVLLVFTNQIRDNIGAFGYAEQTQTVGGKALPFFAGIRIELKRIQQVKDGEVIVGHRIKAKTVKNRTAAPFKETQYEITYGQNDIKYNEIMELGVEHKIIDKSGAWYSYKGERVGQGKDNSKLWLKANPEKTAEIELEIRKKLEL